MATDGAAIASSAMVEDAITVGLAASPTVKAQAAARQHAAAEPVRTVDLPMAAGRVRTQLVAHPAAQRRNAVEDKPAVALVHRTAAAADMAAAEAKLEVAAVHHTATAATGNSAIQHQAAEAYPALPLCI